MKSRNYRLRFVFDANWLECDLSLSTICLERESTRASCPRAQCHVATGPRLVYYYAQIFFRFVLVKKLWQKNRYLNHGFTGV